MVLTQQVDEDCIEETLNERGYLKVNLYGNDDAQRWNKLRQEFLEWALQKAGYDDVSELPELLQKGQILLTGLLNYGRLDCK